VPTCIRWARYRPRNKTFSGSEREIERNRRREEEARVEVSGRKLGMKMSAQCYGRPEQTRNMAALEILYRK
jgi:hypothetical protein